MYDKHYKNKNDLSFDLVYVPEGIDEFRNVHVEAHTKADKLHFSIYSAVDIKIVDLEKLINKIQRDTLSKMKLKVVEDCVFFLNVEEKSYTVEFAPSIIKIGGLKL